MRLLSFFLAVSFSSLLFGQNSNLLGVVKSKDGPIAYASVFLEGTNYVAFTDDSGKYNMESVPFGEYNLRVQILGFESFNLSIKLDRDSLEVNPILKISNNQIEKVVVSGTLKAISKSESPVPVEVYSKEFFDKNPAPSVFETMANINGIRPQLNCNVCNTGDIHINGLEGPYTMIMIDGMPIVSGLSTVYGLMGIPKSLIERVEVVKGPASTLYGSEAVGGIINVITKSPKKSPQFSFDVFGSSWGEVNSDVGVKLKAGNRAHSLMGINYYNYSNKIDNNDDGITDLTLQDRISIFNKWSFDRKKNRVFTMAGRYMYEDRWGGELDWTPEFRGGDSIYGESIYTSRWEVFGVYELPMTEKVNFSFSANGHDQNSVYGDTWYIANQSVLFGQLTWFKQVKKHDFTTGLAYRYTYYDDNSIATVDPDQIHLPGVFIQDQISLSKLSTILLGGRYDYNSNHGNVFSPRANYKWRSKNKKNTLRISTGNGFRVVNLFTEEHAAFTGTRDLIVEEELKPETSWNGNVNYVKKFLFKNDAFLSLDITGFYTYFTNQILPDYDSDPNSIIYDNLDGFSVSQGVSVNTDFSLPNGLNILAGTTVMDVSFTEEDVTQRQMLSERFTATWGVSYKLKKQNLKFDYTGNLYGPMLLPLLGDNDPRNLKSPYWSIQNIQVTKTFKKSLEAYLAIKNLLNFTPPVNSIWGAHDPFDKLNNSETPGIDPADPDDLGFDPAYMFAPNQGIRGNFGIRYTFKK